MKRNVLIIIVGLILYGVTFRGASLLLEQYIIYEIGPVLPVIVFEQMLIPFIFGYIVFKYLSCNNLSSIFYVLIIPVINFAVSYFTSTPEERAVNSTGDLILFLFVVILQPLFILLGSYVQYKVKKLR